MSELAMPQREKYWEELTPEQKLEKIAWAVEYLQRTVNYMAQGVQRLENHVHVGERMFFSEGPVNPYSWPNNNILNRESPSTRLGGF